MVVMMVAMRILVVMLRGKRRAGKNQQEQNSGKNLLHEKNLPRSGGQR
jgi:hypothetical protein